MDKYLIVIPLFFAFILSAGMGPFVISKLKKNKVGQTEREEGLKTHQKKTGTPVMGGLIFLFAILIVGIVYLKRTPNILPILIVTLSFGIIGFMDDFIKVVLKRSMGLKAWQKMGMQFLVTAGYAYHLFLKDMLSLRIPFGNGTMCNLGLCSIPLLFLVVLGTVNGANFTDGVDGLASSVTAVLAMFFIFVSMMLKTGIEPIAAAVFGALLGFLLYNFYPAKVFMGDTGSLALGGFVVSCAYTLQMPLFIPIIAIIYLAEVLSVIIQVGYFKISHGKRIFKMAPLHHHFEKSGWSETKVVGVFTIITILMCFIGLLAL